MILSPVKTQIIGPFAFNKLVIRFRSETPVFVGEENEEVGRRDIPKGMADRYKDLLTNLLLDNLFMIIISNIY